MVNRTFYMHQETIKFIGPALLRYSLCCGGLELNPRSSLRYACNFSATSYLENPLLSNAHKTVEYSFCPLTMPWSTVGSPAICRVLWQTLDQIQNSTRAFQPSPYVQFKKRSCINSKLKYSNGGNFGKPSDTERRMVDQKMVHSFCGG